MLKKMKEFITEQKTTVIGGMCGILTYFLTLFPIMLNDIIIETSLLLIWGKCGFMLLTLIAFIFFGCVIAFGIEDIKNN